MKAIQIFQTIKSEERYFLFTDGSTRKNDTPPMIGLGAEVRDKNGQLVLVFSQQIKISDLPEAISPDASEKYALYKALELCLQENIKKVVISTDSSGLSTKMNMFIESKELQDDNYQKFLCNYKYINRLLYNAADKMEEIFIEYIPRKINKNADFYSRSTHLLLKDYASIHCPQSSNVIPISKSHPKKKKPFNILPSIPYSHQNPKGSLVIAPQNLIEQSYEHRIESTILNIDIQDFKENFSIRFFFEVNKERNIKEFKTIKCNYNENNKAAVLLFIIYNLVSGLSSINLRHAYSEEDKYFNLEYSHDMWATFESSSYARYLKTRIYLPKQYIQEINSFLSNQRRTKQKLGAHFPSFYDVMLKDKEKYVIHHFYDQQRLYVDDAHILAANAHSIKLNEQILKNNYKNIQRAA